MNGSPPRSSGARIVDAPKLPVYDLGDGHPFAPDRQRPLFDFLESHDLVRDDERLVPPPATPAELETIHARDYVDVLATLDLPDDPRHAAARAAALRYGIGSADNPRRPGQHAAAAAAVGGSLALTRAVLAGEIPCGFNPAGGLHHAMPRAASGFCFYNDCAIAIAEARRLGVERVVYVDFDVHHGDGVEHAFRDDPTVLTVSFHQSPDTLWPGTGHAEDTGAGAARGSIVNVPFAPGTTDASWQATVRAVLDAAFTRFRPGFVVTQHGCDPHVSDPLADLSLSIDSFRFAARLSADLAARHCDGRWLATGGGGYRPVAVIPRAWAAVWATQTGRELPDELDPAWRARWSKRGPTPERFDDPPVAEPRAATAAAANERTLARLSDLHGWIQPPGDANPGRT